MNRDAISKFWWLITILLTLALAGSFFYSCRQGNDPESEDDVPYGAVEAPTADHAAAPSHPA